MLAVSYARAMDVTYRSDQEMEKAYLQYVSGWHVRLLRTAARRWDACSRENDDLKPGAHPYAVLSYDYWTRRFGQDPNVIGRTFRLGDDLYEIVGVATGAFTGTETGHRNRYFSPDDDAPRRDSRRLDLASARWRVSIPASRWSRCGRSWTRRRAPSNESGRRDSRA